MSRSWQIAIGAAVVAIVLWIVGIPSWVPIVLLIAAVAAPVVGYLMLDSNQKARIRRMRQRKQLR
jgi:hypothetical protein